MTSTYHGAVGSTAKPREGGRLKNPGRITKGAAGVVTPKKRHTNVMESILASLVRKLPPDAEVKQQDELEQQDGTVTQQQEQQTRVRSTF